MKIQGSVWGNLTYNKNTKYLKYMKTKDKDLPNIQSPFNVIKNFKK